MLSFFYALSLQSLVFRTSSTPCNILVRELNSYFNIIMIDQLRLRFCFLFKIRPTDPFTILELQSLSYDVIYLHKISRSPGHETLKLSTARSCGFSNINKNKISESELVDHANQLIIETVALLFNFLSFTPQFY